MTHHVDASQVRPSMPVVCSNGDEFGTVDCIDAADTIKLTKDEKSQDHRLPGSWATRGDDRDHVDRPAT